MAKEQNDALSIPTFDTSKWTEEQVSFAPYWEPAPGAKIIARLIQKDVDPEERTFARYLLQAGEDIECARGPADEQEKVTVKKGEHFTVSVYYSLQGLFDFYLETGLRPWMQLIALEKVDTSKAGQKVWRWKLLVSPEDKKKADQLRAQLQAKMLAAKNGEKSAELTS